MAGEPLHTRDVTSPGRAPYYPARVDLTAMQLGTIALVGAVLATVAVLLAGGSHLRLSRVQRAYRVLWHDGETDVATLAAAQQRQLAEVRTQLDALRADLALVRADVAQSLRNVAVVRYDAFGDMGGRLSFSCAVVDDVGDGLVFSSIHARGESRTYAKGIVGGASQITLTPEEQQALSAARSDGHTGGTGRTGHAIGTGRTGHAIGTGRSSRADHPGDSRQSTFRPTAGPTEEHR